MDSSVEMVALGQKIRPFVHEMYPRQLTNKQTNKRTDRQSAEHTAKHKKTQPTNHRWLVRTLVTSTMNPKALAPIAYDP